MKYLPRIALGAAACVFFVNFVSTSGLVGPDAPPAVSAQAQPRAPKKSTPEVVTTIDPAKATCAMPVRGARLRADGLWNSTRRNDRVGYYRHHALDIFVAVGTPIYAVRAGTVIYAGDRDPHGWGRIVYIRHDNGQTSLYAHVSTVLVNDKARVRQGQLIAKVGQTGNAKGGTPHVHLEIGDYGDYFGKSRRILNPETWLKRCGGWDPRWNKLAAK